MAKYRNRKALSSDGTVHDSRKEARRWDELRILEKAGVIRDLQGQVTFELIPSQREPDKVGKRGGIIKGRVIERSCVYVADFVYTDCKTGNTVIEDAKGIRTKDYIIKRKLMLYMHGLRIKET